MISRPRQNACNERVFEFYADENLCTGKLPYNWGLGDPWTAGVSVSVVNTSMLEQLDKSSSEIIPKYIKGLSLIHI